MRKLLTLALLLLAAVPSMFARERAWGFCSQGGVQVFVSNVGSTAPAPSFAKSYWMQSYPNCTVTVYLTGTTTLATLYSDNSATPLSNPFTANSNGYWRFYADDGRYDIKFSGTSAGIQTPFTEADILLCDPATGCGGGGGGAVPHNLLSSLHPDTVPYSPPAPGDSILGGLPSASLWQRFAGNSTTTRKVLTQVGNGSATTSQDWTTVDIDCSGTANSFISKFSINGAGSTCATATISNSVNVQWNDALIGTEPTLDFKDSSSITFTVASDSTNNRITISAAALASPVGWQHNNTLVASQPTLNVIDSPTVTATMTNDSANNRVNLTLASLTAPAVPPPPYAVPTGQSVAWALPTNCVGNTPLNTWNPFFAYGQCATNSGTLVREADGFSDPQINYILYWNTFALPTLPGDAVIKNVYPVIIGSSYGNQSPIPSAGCDLSGDTSGAFALQTTPSGGYFAGGSLGTTSSAITSATCFLESSASGGFPHPPPNTLTVAFVGLAVYYTTATPPVQTNPQLFISPYYPSLIGVAPQFTSVADGSPISWSLGGNFIANGYTTLNHITPTRALNVSNMQNGGVYHFSYLEDSTGGATLTLGSGCNWYVNNVATTSLGLSTSANALQEFYWIYDGSNCFVDTTAASGGGGGPTGFAYLGAWSNSTSYVTNNIVSLSGSSYIALSNNTGVQPGTDGGVTWAVLAAAGAQGPAGPSGTNGTDGAPGAPGYSPNQILSGCGVAYASGLSFTVSACSYVIQNVTYGLPAATVTLAAADPSLDRIDVIAVNTSGVATVITGTPASNPAPPTVDINSQLQLTFAYVAAGASTPSNITTTDIYHENAEWTCASSAHVVCNSTSNPHSGTYDIEATSMAASNYARLTIPSGSIDISQSNQLVFWIRSKAAWASSSLTMQWYNGSTAKCTPVALANGNFGFSSSNITTYQQIVVPTNLFSCAGIPVTRLQFTLAGSAITGFYLDDIILQGGLPQSSGSAAMRWQGAWSSTTTYQVNDTVTYQNLTYTAIQTNTNLAPSANPTAWSVHSFSVPGVVGNLLYNNGTNVLRPLNTSVSGSDITFPGIVYGTQFQSTDTVNNTQITFLTGSGGDSTCPTPTAGQSYLCNQSNVLNVSQNGAAYVPIGAGSGTIGGSGTTNSLAKFTASTTIGNADLSGDVATSGSTATTLASKYKTKVCEITIGDPGSASPVLADDNDSPSVCGNDTGADVTVTAVACYADAGTPTVTPILTGGSGTSILTGALTCGTASWAAGTVNGTPTIHSFSANGATCSSTPCTLDANITTAGGTAKYIVIRLVLAQ